MDILVDINKVNEAKKAYKEYSNQLTETIKKLKRSVDNIESQWKGLAKDSFENSHFPKVYESMTKHNKKIEKLYEELNYISTQFSSLETDINNRTK